MKHEMRKLCLFLQSSSTRWVFTSPRAKNETMTIREINRKSVNIFRRMKENSMAQETWEKFSIFVTLDKFLIFLLKNIKFPAQHHFDNKTFFVTSIMNFCFPSTEKAFLPFEKTFRFMFAPLSTVTERNHFRMMRLIISSAPFSPSFLQSYSSNILMMFEWCNFPYLIGFS